MPATRVSEGVCAAVTASEHHTEAEGSGSQLSVKLQDSWKCVSLGPL